MFGMKAIDISRFFALGLLGGLLLLTGCATATYKPAVKFGQLNLEASVPREDLVVLDAVEGTSREDAYVLGLVRVIDGDKWQVLGIKFFEDHCASPQGYTFPWCFCDPVAGRAYYNALEQAPQADAVMERSSSSSVKGFPFLYSSRQVTYRGKAIQLKVR
jgi:hypothetical protein